MLARFRRPRTLLSLRVPTAERATPRGYPLFEVLRAITSTIHYVWVDACVLGARPHIYPLARARYLWSVPEQTSYVGTRQLTTPFQSLEKGVPPPGSRVALVSKLPSRRGNVKDDVLTGHRSDVLPRHDVLPRPRGL